MRQPPSGAERSRSLGITGLGMSLKQEREPSESSGAKEKFWMLTVAALTVALMLLWSRATEERQVWTWNSGKWEKEKGEEGKEREIKKKEKISEGSKKLCQGHLRYVYSSRRTNHFCLVCSGFTCLFWFNLIQGRVWDILHRLTGRI